MFLSNNHVVLVVLSYVFPAPLHVYRSFNLCIEIARIYIKDTHTYPIPEENALVIVLSYVKIHHLDMRMIFCRFCSYKSMQRRP